MEAAAANQWGVDAKSLAPGAPVYHAGPEKSPRPRAAIAGRAVMERLTPTTVTLELTPEISASHTIADSGIDKSERLSAFFGTRSTPSRSDWLNVVAAVPAGGTLRLAGGDPLQSPHLETLVFEADRRGLEVEIVTPGARLEEYAPVIYGLGVAGVRVRLDSLAGGTGEQIDFEKAARGVRALRALRDRARRPALVMDVHLRAETAGSAAEMAWRALAADADKVVVYYPEYEDVKSRPEYVAAIEDLARTRKGFPPARVRMFPDFSALAAARFYSGEPVSVGPAKCDAPWREAFVGPDGKARLCSTVTLGDIRTEPLDGLFDGPNARACRRAMRKAFPPECARCTGRFGGGGRYR
jgi:MoaA/NifB/PqqE/SkfB family radical SAM enzyme